MLDISAVHRCYFLSHPVLVILFFFAATRGLVCQFPSVISHVEKIFMPENMPCPNTLTTKHNTIQHVVSLVPSLQQKWNDYEL